MRIGFFGNVILGAAAEEKEAKQDEVIVNTRMTLKLVTPVGKWFSNHEDLLKNHVKYVSELIDKEGKIKHRPLPWLFKSSSECQIVSVWKWYQ